MLLLLSIFLLHNEKYPTNYNNYHTIYVRNCVNKYKQTNPGPGIKFI